MQQHLRAFAKSATAAFDLQGPALAFGLPGGDPSDDCWLRDWFGQTSGMSCQLDEGALPDDYGVGGGLPFPAGTVRTTFCVNTVEHFYRPRETMRELIHTLAPGGAMVVASSWDDTLAADLYVQRLAPRGLRELLAGLEVTLIGWQGPADEPHSVYGIGFKSPAASAVLEGANCFLREFPGQLHQLAARQQWRFHWRKLLALCRRRGDHYRLWRDYYTVQFLIDLPGNCQHSPVQEPKSLQGGKTGTRLDLGS